MGMNYYHETNRCDCCKRFDMVHIGKSSAGWTFSFHGTDTIRSWADWKAALATGRIVDESGEVVTLEAFAAKVDAKRANTHNHTVYCRAEHPQHASRDCWLDPEGNSFSSAEFS